MGRKRGCVFGVAVWGVVISMGRGGADQGIGVAAHRVADQLPLGWTTAGTEQGVGGRRMGAVTFWVADQLPWG
jgi:hypothetical protein